jgi:hypothetical protein
VNRFVMPLNSDSSAKIPIVATNYALTVSLDHNS